MEHPSQDDSPSGGEPEPDAKASRKRGDRFKEGDEALQQLEEIEELQRKIRQGKARGVIDSIEKSSQRAKTKLRDIRRIRDVEELE